MEDDAPLRVQYRIGDMSAPALPATEALKTEVEHIVACVLDGAEPLCGIDAAIGVVATLDAAQRSLSSGGAPVEVTIPG
jgi:hypothetical protein